MKSLTPRYLCDTFEDKVISNLRNDSIEKLLSITLYVLLLQFYSYLNLLLDGKCMHYVYYVYYVYYVLCFILCTFSFVHNSSSYSFHLYLVCR